MTIIKLDVDPALKKQAEEIFSKIGLSLSEAVIIFLKAAVRCGEMPFDYESESKRRAVD